MKKIILLLKFCRRFGFVKSLKNFIKIQFGYTNNIKISGIKYKFSLRNKTSDISTFYQLFLNKEYDISLKKPQFIIDGGANIGLFAILMKQRYPESKIICIEPDTENFNMLKKNVSSYNDVYCEHGGIWDKDTKLIAYDKYNRGKWGIVVEENINGNISAISINTLIAKYDIQYIDILKLDIETSEKQLFSNNYDIWLPKIKTIIIELHDRIEEGCSKSFFEAINRSFSKYTFSMKGENVIIENNDMNNV